MSPEKKKAGGKKQNFPIRIETLGGGKWQKHERMEGGIEKRNGFSRKKDPARSGTGSEESPRWLKDAEEKRIAFEEVEQDPFTGSGGGCRGKTRD